MNPKQLLLRISVFLLSVISCYLGNAQSDIKSKKLNYSAAIFSCNSLLNNGHVQVRERSYSGSYLNLNNDLGLKTWMRPGFSIRLDIKKKNQFSFTYCESIFKGGKYLKTETWYNGTLLVADSKADITNSIFRSFEWVWMARVYSKGNHNLFIRTGVLYERLKFYVDAEIDENSPIKETFEKFWKQQQPLPTFGVADIYHINDQLALKGEISFTYLPKVKTWMNEGGIISLKQSNLDVHCVLFYQYKKLFVESGCWFKHLKLLEESNEDSNDFLINGWGYKISVGCSF